MKKLIRESRNASGQVMTFLMLSVLSAGYDPCFAKESAVETLQRVQEERARGELRAAVIELKNILQINPNDYAARLQLAEVYDEIGDGVAAESEARRALQLGAPDMQATPLVAQSLYIQRNYKKALDELSAFEERNKSISPDVAATKIDVLIALGKVVEAKKAATQATAISPALLLAQARLAIAQRDMTSAQSLVAKAMEQAPKSVDVWLQKADVEFAQARFPDASKSYAQSVELSGKNNVTERSMRARVGWAFTLLAQNLDDDALPLINDLLKAQPKHPLPNYLRGLVAYKKNDYATATDYLQRNISTTPVGSPAYVLLGAVNYAQGNLVQADEYLTKYIAVVPNDMFARKLLGAVRLKQGQPDRAMAVLGKDGTLESDDVKLLSMVGTAAAMAGDYREGKKYFERALKLKPESGELRNKLAETYIAEGDYEQAMKELNVSVHSNDAALQAKALIVETNLRKKNFDVALSDAQELVKSHPDDPALVNLLGIVQLNKKDRVEARRQFERAVQLKPDLVPAVLNLARMNQQDNKLDDARRGYQTVLAKEPANGAAMIALAQMEDAAGKPELALEWLEKVRAADASAVAPRLLLARFYFRMGAADKAIVAIQEVVQRQPNHPGALSLLGDAQFARQDYKAALATFERVAKLRPKDASVVVKLGQVQRRLGHTDLARQSFNQAMQMAPGTFLPVASLAMFEAESRNFSAAHKLTQDWLGANPKAANGYELQGDIYSLEKKVDDAVLAYEKAAARQNTGALAVKRSHVIAQSSHASNAALPLTEWLQAHPEDGAVRVNLADTLRNEQKFSQAADEYNRVIQTEPRSLVAWNNLALTYLALRDNRALQAAEKAYEISAKHPAVADTLGWVLLQQGDAARGAQLLSQAYEKLPDQPDVAYHLAMASAKQGNTNRAKELLDAALSSKNPFEAREAAQQERARIK